MPFYEMCIQRLFSLCSCCCGFGGELHRSGEAQGSGVRWSARFPSQLSCLHLEHLNTWLYHSMNHPFKKKLPSDLRSSKLLRRIIIPTVVPNIIDISLPYLDDFKISKKYVRFLC